MSSRFASTTCLFCFTIFIATTLSAQTKSQPAKKISERTKKEFFFAIRQCQHQNVERMLKKYPQTKYANFRDQIAFMVAVRESDPQTVKLFLKYGADPNFKDSRGLTPLYKSVDPDIAQVLINHGADVNYNSKNGKTLVQSVLIYGNVKLARLLYKKGAAKDDLESMISSNLTDDAINFIKRNPKKSKVDTDAFRVAANRGNFKVVQAFLDIGADPNQCIQVLGGTGYGPSSHFSPLGSAVNSQNYDMTELLLKNGADANQKVIGGVSSALYMAVYHENLKIVKLLHKHGAKINQLNPSERDTPLHVAAFSGNLEIIKFLIDNGADVNLKTESGITPLEYALKQPAILKYLIEKKAKIDFFSAIAMGKTDILKKLLADNPKLLTEEHPDFFLTPISLAVQSGQIDVVKLFVSEGLNLNEKCTVYHPEGFAIEGSSLLHFAIYQDDIPMMRYLINQKFNVETADDSGSTPLMLALSENRTEAVKLLLQSGAKIGAKDNDGATAIHHFSFDNLDILKLLLKSKPDLDANFDGNWTLLMCAAEESQVVANYLIQQGAKIDFRSACLLGLKNKANGFLCKDPKLVHVRTIKNPDASKYSMPAPFDEAVKRGHYEIFRLFLDKGRAVYPLKRNEEDPLTYAIESGNLKIVKTLLELNGKIVREIYNQTTPLEKAIEYNHLHLVEYFLSKGAKSNARFSALHLAAAKGNLQIVKKLVASGMSVHRKDEFHKQPIHYAALCGQTDIIAYLIEKGSSVNSRMIRDKTPLGLAIWGQRYPMSAAYEFVSDADKIDYKPAIELLKKHGGKK